MLDLEVAQNVAPMAEDESVTRVREQPEMAGRERTGEGVRLRCRDRPVLVTLEDPHLGADLVEGKAPRSTLKCTIPSVRVDSLLGPPPGR